MSITVNPNVTNQSIANVQGTKGDVGVSPTVKAEVEAEIALEKPELKALSKDDIAKLNRSIGQDGLSGSEILKQLKALATGSAPAGADVAELGEVDIDVPLGTSNASFSAEALSEIFSGDDVQLQGALLQVLDGFASAARTDQRSASSDFPNWGNVDYQSVMNDLDSVISSSKGSGESTNLPAMLGSSASAYTSTSASSMTASAGLTESWGKMMGGMGGEMPTDVNALVQWVLRQSYLETTQDLMQYAEKVKFFNENKKAIRDELAEARDVLTTVAGGEDDAPVTYTGKDISGDFTGGQDISTTTGTAITNKAELDNYIKDMEEQLSSIGDDAQLANVDLQNVLQKQQQTMQMMSNIGKMLHDTTMAVIRKIGG